MKSLLVIFNLSVHYHCFARTANNNLNFPELSTKLCTHTTKRFKTFLCYKVCVRAFSQSNGSQTVSKDIYNYNYITITKETNYSLL